MPSWAQQKEQIRTAINAGRHPRFTDDGRQIVTLGQGRGSYVVLTRANGELTKAGKFYYEETKRQRPNSSFDPDQPLTRHSNTDYIKELHPEGSTNPSAHWELFGHTTGKTILQKQVQRIHRSHPRADPGHPGKRPEPGEHLRARRLHACQRFGSESDHAERRPE